MKCLIVFAVVVAVVSAQFGSFNRGRPQARLQARPQQRAYAQLRPAASQVTVKRVAPPRGSSNDQNAQIVRYDSDITPESGYRYSYETDNGITAEEQGNSASAQGSFAYTAPDGQPISVTYVADENGFQPQGAHLPVPPAIPEAILRALEWNANHPEEENL